jgi:hypothetical protein
VTGDPVTWVVAVLQVGTAIGIAVFWITWLRAEHEEPWLPDGYVEHERAFVLPDSVLALLLAGSGLLQVLDRPPGDALALVAAGMLLFLGLIDAAYFARTGMFARDRGGVGNAAIVLWMLVLAAVLLWRNL